jgi:uncharacterized membrane protein YgaE (UPF0421/DUF939 family)
MTNKKTHLRGFNDIQTRMTQLGSRNTRAQQANLLARLEHQKALLEGQLQVWRKQQSVTERRLQMVRTQIRIATQALKVVKSAPRAVERPSRCSSGVPAPAAASPRRRHDLEFSF